MAGPTAGSMWEVEVKFHHGDFAPLRETLKGMGGIFLGCAIEEDTYFRHPSRDFAVTGEAMRIRSIRESMDKIGVAPTRTPASAPQSPVELPSFHGNPSVPNDAGPLKSVLCYKGPRLSGPAKVRQEIETEVNGAGIRPLLEALGFLPVLTISKKRESWKLGKNGEECVICMDEAHGLGNFVEVEVVAKAEQREKAQARVMDFAKHLGLGAKEDRSYLRMQLEKCR